MIELQGVTVRYPGSTRPVLENVSFRLTDGEHAVLLGANGSGKTTLVRLLNGTQRPSEGQVVIDGTPTAEDSRLVAVRRSVGLLFQDPDNQFVSTTAEREIAFGLENLAIPAPEIRQIVDTALGDFDLVEHRQAPPHEMSGGEKARLALACVWVMGPRAILLDETESLLDRAGSELLLRKVESLPHSTTLLRVTTDPEVAAQASRMLVLDGGRLVADGSPDAVLASLSPELCARLGEPLAWRLSSRLTAAGHLRQPTASWQALVARLAGPNDDAASLEGP